MESEDRVLEYYMKEAESGNADAQFKVARWYEKGKGVDQSDKDAFYWYHKAAEQGHKISQFDLAGYYAAGRGTEASLTEAAKWALRSAEQGYSLAQAMLGLYYENGKGVEQSYEEALKWYSKAAEDKDAPEDFIESVKTRTEGLQMFLNRDISIFEILHNKIIDLTRELGQDYIKRTAELQDIRNSLQNINNLDEFFERGCECRVQAQDMISQLEAMLKNRKANEGTGLGCSIILAFLISPVLAVCGYGLYNLLSWIC